jgi:Family of unknown function (DUF5678)
MTAINWTELFDKHKGKWVALGDDQYTAISAGDDLKRIRETAIRKGHSDPIFTRVPTELTYFVGSQV